MYGVQTGCIKTKSQLDSCSALSMTKRGSTGSRAGDSCTREYKAGAKDSISGPTAQSSSLDLKTQPSSASVPNRAQHVKNVS